MHALMRRCHPFTANPSPICPTSHRHGRRCSTNAPSPQCLLRPPPPLPRAPASCQRRTMRCWRLRLRWFARCCRRGADVDGGGGGGGGGGCGRSENKHLFIAPNHTDLIQSPPSACHVHCRRRSIAREHGALLQKALKRAAACNVVERPPPASAGQPAERARHASACTWPRAPLA